MESQTITEQSWRGLNLAPAYFINNTDFFKDSEETYRKQKTRKAKLCDPSKLFHQATFT